MQIVTTKNAPAAIGPYSQAVAHNGLLYASGQIALLPNGEFAQGGAAAQAKQVFANLKNVLEAGGSGTDKVLKTTLFLTDINDFEPINALYAEFFGDHKPARSTIVVKQLPKNALVELECIAALS
ncbi:MAG: Rid family detoxifying hydrolase [Helicobacteraceae bacterium]|jgi:2-iminobutanoate/2-iminopropanoate deaminase|nr:Rid family detoxifying hydrolase [Helicobacteraceae bacterium]